MSYGDFIAMVKSEDVPGHYVMKESRVVSAAEDGELQELLLESIRKDVVEPEFYGNFAKLETIELMQGAILKEKPHYEKSEQYMCLIEGEMSIMLVPHVFRQEVAGGSYTDAYKEHESRDWMNMFENKFKARQSSPINFFNPDIKKYPFWKNVDKTLVEMKPGDCLFIPAYHYYQFNAENLGTTQMGRKGLNRLQKKDG